MAIIKIEGMEFFSYHGCMEEEQIIGNKFRIDISIDSFVEEAAVQDDLTKTINYQVVYELIAEEMKIKSKLLENIAFRIINKIHEHFPSANEVEIQISKLNPPLHGKIDSVSVVMKEKFN